MRRRTPPLVLVAIFSLVGLSMLVVAGGVEIYQRRALEKLSPAQGEVISNVRSGKGYKPVVRFTPPIPGDPEPKDAVEAPRSVQMMGSVSSNPPAYKAGEQVEVYYDPADPFNPDKAVLKGFLEQHFITLVFGLLGGIFSLIGGGMGLAYLMARARQRAAEPVKGFLD
ncbi:MAG: DUF3592 domain-containing protein [Planctomycetota bacterium]|nr:DUF3592 domain-containing protein [Planctomycetota bacterium]